MTEKITGADLVVRTLKDLGVEVVFGYPGGAVLPIYDSLFGDNGIRHILVRHEQGAAHAAEGYARSTGRPGVLLVTSGPGATNSVTGLTDALMDSIPIICLTGQVPTFLIGNDAFQEADTVGITRPCTKHNWLVRDVDNLARTIHEAFYVATTGRPGPVVVDIPKDVQFANVEYSPPTNVKHNTYNPQVKPDPDTIANAVAMIEAAERPLFYTGGGIINAGREASTLLRELVDATEFPITSTLMGLGAYPASGKHWLGMLGMHGTYQANLAMHGCDLMIAVGARFDDRITGRIDAFSPGSRKIHIDIDPSSINKNVEVDVPIIADAGHALESILSVWKSGGRRTSGDALARWRNQLAEWEAVDCLAYENSSELIKPQLAIQRLYEQIRERDFFITTEVGQHQMWAAQFIGFDEPHRWMTSGGLGTMGYGLPAAIGTQVAHPDSLVIDIAGEASFMMVMQEMSTAVQHKLPIKVFIINNRYLGMVRQWQELLHGGRYAHSYSDALPDFVKLAEAFGCRGIRCENPAELDNCIKEMLEDPGPVIFDVVVDPHENCFPMIPSGKAHNEMILSESANGKDSEIDDAGKVMV